MEVVTPAGHAPKGVLATAFAAVELESWIKDIS